MRSIEPERDRPVDLSFSQNRSLSDPPAKREAAPGDLAPWESFWPPMKDLRERLPKTVIYFTLYKILNQHDY
jgi:hypothetical protein